MRIANPQARAVFADSESRVRSIALPDEKLYLVNVDMNQDVRGLTAELLGAYGESAGRVRITTDAGDVSLGIDAAAPCGLIINELVTNALKHGFPSKIGRIEVRMREAYGRVGLIVSDDGTGMPAGLDLETAPTLGLRLIRTLSRKLCATMTRERSQGTCCTISFRSKANDGEEA